MNRIPLIRPYVEFDDLKEDFREILQTGTLTKGYYISEFRNAIRDYTGANYCFLTTSATTSLFMALHVLGVGEGDEVIVSDFSFPATANVVEQVGAKPIFADVDINTFNMKCSSLEELINPRTKAVIFVDAFGNPSGLPEIHRICKAHGIPLIEDAACAFGSAVCGQKCGSLADITCFSFHPRKLMTTGEGGAITTNSESYARRLNIKLNHGAQPNHTGKRLEFVDFGFNFRMSELQAALGLSQIGKLTSIIEQRNHTFASYQSELEPIGFKPQLRENGVTHNAQSVVFRTPAGTSRDHLIEKLSQENIETTIGTYALSNEPYFRRKYAKICENAIKLYETTITLPCFDNVDYERVIHAIKMLTR